MQICSGKTNVTFLSELSNAYYCLQSCHKMSLKNKCDKCLIDGVLCGQRGVIQEICIDVKSWSISSFNVIMSDFKILKY